MSGLSMEFIDNEVYNELLALYENNTVNASHVALVHDGLSNANDDASSSDSVAESHVTSTHDDLGHLDGLSYTADTISRAHSAPKRGRRKRPTRSFNLSRERRKQELEYLRTLVVDLQNELTALQQRRDEFLRPHFVADTGELVTIVPVWEDMAKRQIQARRKAENETVRLKTLLTAQAQVAQDLMEVMQRAKRIQQEAIGLMPIETVAEQADTIPEQLKRVRVLCGQWRAAFSWCPQLQSGPMRFMQSKVISDDGRDTVLDFYTNQTFPFSVAQVENAIWAVLQVQSTDVECAYTPDGTGSKDTLVGKYTISSCKEGLRTTRKGTYASHRFRNEQGHLLIASHVYAVPEHAHETQSTQEFVMTEDTWIRIIDSRELQRNIPLTESTPTLTVLQHIRRSRHRFKNVDHNSDARVQTLLDTHLCLVEAQLRFGQQTIESMLIRGITNA